MLSFRMLVEQHCLSPLGHQCQDKSVESCWQEKWPSIGNNKQVPYYWPHHLSQFPQATYIKQASARVGSVCSQCLPVRSASVTRLHLCRASYLANIIYLYQTRVGELWKTPESSTSGKRSFINVLDWNLYTMEIAISLWQREEVSLPLC